MSFRICPLYAVPVVLAVWATSCKDPQPPAIPGRFYTGEFLGKPYTIDVVGDSSDYSAAFDSLLGAVSAAGDLSNPHSVISLFNAFDRTDSAFAFYDSTGVFGILFDLTRDYHHRTNGIFDPTLNPIRRAWQERQAKGWNKGEPDLDELFQYTVFDNAKVDLIELNKEDGYTYEKSYIRKADPRIELDFTALAGAYGMDRIAAFLDEKSVAQWKITYDRASMNRGAWADSLAIIPLGISQNEADQKIRLNGGAFTFCNASDKARMIDPSYGYPPQSSELIYVAVVAPHMTDAVVFSEAFMVMGLEDATLWYEHNPESKVESFMLIQRGEEITNASTLGFDQLLVVPEALTPPEE